VLAAALGIAPALQWKRTRPERLVRDLGWLAGGSAVLGVAVPLLLVGALQWQVLAAVALGLWILGSHAKDLIRRGGMGLRRIPLAYWGMTCAHVGFAVTMLGVALTTALSVERDMRMSVGQELPLGALTVRFDGMRNVEGPNFIAQEGEFLVTEGNRQLRLRPQKRRYLASDNVMTEAAISAGFTRDIYISLGEPVGGGDWAVRVQHKPFVRWIWLGGLLMTLGGVVAVGDARYRRLRERTPAADGSLRPAEIPAAPDRGLA
jgi:cytochrome c-type biogenesis protein CcmF